MPADAFDFVIVGAGSAGCVLASRLTEDPSCRVALIEAGGPDDRREIHIPIAFSRLFRTAADWAYMTDEQPHLDDRRLYWPRGKVIGGSSSMNAMIYTRGHPADFDEWERTGSAGWSFAAVEPYFGRTLLDIGPLRTKNALSDAFVRACEDGGLPRRDSFRDGTEAGAGFFDVTQRRGARCSCATAYLDPAKRRPNLTVVTRTLTTRILFDGRRAVGVETVRDGQVARVRAEREVLLCGGAINSPQLLLLSGIGRADDLRRLSIDVQVDLPGVGKNLQDHLVAGAAYVCTKPVSLAHAETAGNLLRYLLFRRGMLTSNVAEAGAFLRTRDDLERPDLELIFGPVYYIDHGFERPKGDAFSVGAVLLDPKSRGSLGLRSTDPTAAPSIQPNYLDHSDDRAVLREGVRRCIGVAEGKAFESYRGARMRPADECRTDAELDAFIRETAQTLYHPVGTCRMGDDAMCVVDPHLRVYGVDGLRVIDASIMPSLVTGHPNAAVVMIAERGADELRGSNFEARERKDLSAFS